MKYSGLLFFLLLPLFSFSQLTLQITDIEEAKGKMFIAVYNSAEGFPDTENAIERVIIPVNSLEFSHTFSQLPSGALAIAIFHDTNDNGVFDTNFLGLPKECYGFSNDVMGTFGPPKFKAATFPYESDQAKAVSIRLK